MKKKYTGVAAVLASAFIFGFCSSFGKLTVTAESSSLMLIFLRGGLAIPVLFVILKLKRISLALSHKELRDVLLVGLLGMAPTNVLLTWSFDFVPVGLATVLHFSYPVMVMLAGTLIFKDGIQASKVLALALCTAGIAMVSLEGVSNAATLGFIMALASAVTYSVYIFGYERTSVSSMHHLKAVFYFAICSTVLSGILALISGRMTFDLSPVAWGSSFTISVLVQIVAFSLFQVGIVHCGSANSAILSALEPITGIFMGIMLLGERLSSLKWAGCAVILASMLITALAGRRASKNMLDIQRACDGDTPLG